MALVKSLPDALAPLGFRAVQRGGDQQILQRQGFSLTKFGMLDTFVITTERERLDVDELKQFSADAMREARIHKFFLPCGLFSVLVTYPVVYIDKADPEVVDFIEGYSPKHYSAFEFPVIAERSTQTLHYYTGTPIWGAAYYKGFRSEAEQLVGF